jgi:GTP-binding protein LepA
MLSRSFKATITKSDYVGNVMRFVYRKRGQITNQTYLTTERVELTFDMPLAEIVFDFTTV